MAVEATSNVTVPVAAAPVAPKKDAKTPAAPAGAPQKTDGAPVAVGAGPTQATPTAVQGKKLYAMA